MDDDQLKFQVKKKLTLFASLFLVGMMAIFFFTCN